VAVPRDEGIDAFRDPDHTRNPEKESDRNEKGNTHPEKSNGARTAVNLVLRRDAVDRFEEILASDVRSDLAGAGILQGDHLDLVQPVHPAQGATLEGAHRAITVEEENMLRAVHSDDESCWRDRRMACASSE
jgi:hypothetical protein